MTRKMEVVKAVTDKVKAIESTLTYTDDELKNMGAMDEVAGFIEPDTDIRLLYLENEGEQEADAESNGIKVHITVDCDPYMDGGISVTMSAEYKDPEDGTVREETTAATLDKDDIAEAVERLIGSITEWDDEDIDMAAGMNPCYRQEKPRRKPERFDISRTTAPLNIGLGTLEMPENRRSTDKTFIDYLDEAGFDYITDIRKPARRPYGGDDTGYVYKEDPDNRYYELKEIFGCTELTDDELMCETPWSLLGITAHQFHKIDSGSLSDRNMHEFIGILQGQRYKDAVPDVLQRIHLSTVMVNAGIYSISDTEDIKYISRITGKLSINEGAVLLMTYMDYLRSRSKAVAYNDKYIQDNDDPEHPYYSYPRHPKQGRIGDLHDKASRDAIQFDDRENKKSRKAFNKRIAELNKTPDYMQFLYRSDKYSVIPARSVEELIEEGKYLNHCIGTYGEQFASGESYIYFIRENRAIDTPYYSAEIIPGNGYYALTQLYTFYDSTNKTPEFRDFINQWCRDRNIYPKCTI